MQAESCLFIHKISFSKMAMIFGFLYTSKTYASNEMLQEEKKVNPFVFANDTFYIFA